MIYRKIWVSIYSFKCFKTVWSGLFTSTLFSPCNYRLDRNGMWLKFLRILITVIYFKDRNWISKTINCISCSVICKINFCYDFPDIPDKAGKVTRRTRMGRRGRTKAIAKRYAFHTNAKSMETVLWKVTECRIPQARRESFNCWSSTPLLSLSVRRKTVKLLMPHVWWQKYRKHLPINAVNWLPPLQIP